MLDIENTSAMASKDSVAMLQHSLHMNCGDEETSYAKNSSVQGSVIKKSQSVLKETIKAIANDGFPRCFNIADLGCSSGPNTLSVISSIIDEVHEVCKEKNIEAPQFQICLNDLFGNDFNAIFKSLPMFYAKYNMNKEENSGRCFMSAVPGSFYERLFSDESMHFFYSSTSLQWLSQVPKSVENNKLNIIGKWNSPIVLEMYKIQFQKDFTMFLDSRSREIVRGGHMVLTFPGRSTTASPCWNDSFNDMLAKSLVEMASEGLVTESEINSFNVPIYTPYKDEVEDLINKQGQFSIDVFETFDVHFATSHGTPKVSDEPTHGKKVAKIIRAGWEPMLVTHFQTISMDILAEKFEKYLDSYLSPEELKFFNLVISLTKV